MRQYIKGYYRGEEPSEPEAEPNLIEPTLITLGAALTIISLVYWQVSLTVLVTSTLAYLGFKQLEKTGLTVTYMAKKVKVLS